MKSNKSVKTKTKRKKKKKKRKSNGHKMSIIFQNLLISLIVSLFISFSLFFIFFSINLMNNSSMDPVIEKGDRVLVSKFDNKLNRFDIVGFEDAGKIDFKRIIGMPGDSVKYSEDFLYINDQLVDEKFIINQINEYALVGKVFTQSSQDENVFRVTKIPKDYYFVLGDNRPNSTDSRQLGLLEKKRIKGKIKFLIVPVKKIN